MANNSSVSSFLGKINQGVRPNLFRATINFPTSATFAGDADLRELLCKSAALPASNLGVIEVPFRGRTVKVAGDRTFDTWTATFINDRNFVIRHSMEKWMQEINSHEANTASRFVPSNAANGYVADIIVDQLERDSNVNASPLRTYKLHSCFPTNVSQIDLAYDSNDQIEDFTVEFQLQYWTVVSTSTPTATSVTTTGNIA